MEAPMAVVDPPKLRTYGNWRKPRSAGLGKLDARTTVALFAFAAVGVPVLFIGGLGWAVAYVVIAGLVLLAVIREDKHGRSIVTRLGSRANFRRARRRKTTLYRSGVLGFTPWGTNQLPGIAAQTRLSEWHDSWGRPFGLIHAPVKNHFTVVFRGEPEGGSLVDQEQIDSWVAHWGAWLNAFGNEAGAVAASVTIETAPDYGTRLRREVMSSRDINAPDFAIHVMDEIMARYPRGSATVHATVAVTFRGTATEGGKRRNTEEVARDLASRIGLMGQGLSNTGAGAVRPLTAQELCEMVRIAYDPAAAEDIAEAQAEGTDTELSWDNSGPVGAEAYWDSYRHDSGLSRTWQMTQAPRGEVYADVLLRLLEPSPLIDRKRVTLLYRPYDSARSAEIVERDRNHAQVRTTSTARPTQRVLLEQRSAEATAAEEAKGAGLVNFGMLVTATVLEENSLKDASATVSNLAATARLMLRPVTGAQDSAFAAALPIGLVLPEYQSLRVVGA